MKRCGNGQNTPKMTRITTDKRPAASLPKPTARQGAAVSGLPKSARARLAIQFSMSEIEPYQEAARLIAGKKRAVPSWFAEHLRRWASSLFLDAAVYRKQPGRAEILQRIRMVRDVVQFLGQSLVEGPILEFLEAAPGGRIESRGMLLEQLKQLAARAERALGSPSLVTEKGVAKPGRGRALPPGATTPEAYCAALIAEAWNYLRGRELASGNKQAQAAAASLWAIATKGRRPRADEPEARWRIHLGKATSPELSDIRAEFRRHMIESANIYRMLAEENSAMNPPEKS